MSEPSCTASSTASWDETDLLTLAEEHAASKKIDKRRVSDVYLIIDDRERAVIPFIETELGARPEAFAYRTKQINTGDYIICRKPKLGAQTILACIERKTLDDFAAGFCDGRYDNIKKMRELREKSGCQLYYLIEGPAFPNPARRFKRIPYSNILAAITKLMMREGVFIIQTEDERHSATRLADLLHVFAEETPFRQMLVPDTATASATSATSATSVTSATSATSADELEVPEVLQGRTETSDSDEIVYVWERLPGVTIVFGKVLCRTFSVADLMAKKVTVDQLKALKTVAGRPIHKIALASLTAVRSGMRKYEVSLLSGVRGVTPAMAEMILDATGGLARLCSYSSNALALTQLTQKTRQTRLGKARADRIRRLMQYKEGVAIQAEPEGHTLDARAASTNARVASTKAQATPPTLPLDDDDDSSDAPAVPVMADEDVDQVLADAGF